MKGLGVRILFVLMIVSYILGCEAVKVSMAQTGDVIWSQPLNLSSSSTRSVHPAIVADAYGHIHVFWSEDIGGQQTVSDAVADVPNTIFYRCWNGQVWLEPLDILAVADDSLADFVAATVDAENRFHLVWTGMSDFYYSTAPVAEAYSVRAWSTPQIIASDNARTAFESDVVVDTLGNVHIIYATRGRESAPGVFHIMLPSDSAAWTLPIKISTNLRDNEAAFKDVRLVVDAADRLHAAWSTVNTNGYGQAAYYAGGDALANVFTPPVLLADATINNGFTGFPSLLPYGRDELLLIHVDERNKGRIERTSVDAGRTWSEPRFVLSGMEGVNGFLIPLLDGDGGLHLVINMRTMNGQRVGIYYAPRVGLDWSPVLPVAVEEPYGPSAHYTDAVMRMGNEIHAVWTELRSGEIWYVKGSIDGVAPVPTQAIALAPTSVAAEMQAADAPAIAMTESALASSHAPDRPFFEVTAQSGETTTLFTPILMAIIPVALLVACVVLWRVFRR